MIKFRQKDFSKPITRSLYKVKTIKESVMGGIKKGLETLGKRDMYGKVTPSTNVKPVTHKINRVKIAKEAIKDTKAIENLPRNTVNVMNKAALDPGQTINQATELTLRNPITTVTGVGGKVVMFAPGIPTAVRTAPIGSVGLAAEQGLKKISPKYRKATNKVADGYRKSIAPRIRDVVNSTVDVLKQQPMFM